MTSSMIDAGQAKIRFRSGNRSEFHRVLKHRVRAHLAQEGVDRYADWRLWFKSAIYLSVAAGSYATVLLANPPMGVMLLVACLYTSSVLLLAISLGHDAVHDAVSRKSWVNRVLQSASFMLLGANSYLWRLRHVKSHHTFPNVNGCDIDIDENPFLRLSPNHPRRPWQRFQHVYAPLAYMLAAIHTIVYQDFVYLRKRNLANLRDIHHPWWAYGLFVAGKLVYLSVTFAVPIAVIDLPWWWIAIGAFIATGFASLLFVALLVGTHFAEESSFLTLDERNHLPHDWSEHALLTSVDWNPRSRFAAFLSGGVNMHAAHHLFPSISHVHYRAISRIIEDTAREFGLRHNVTTFSRLVRSHAISQVDGAGASSPRRAGLMDPAADGSVRVKGTPLVVSRGNIASFSLSTYHSLGFDHQTGDRDDGT